MYCFTHWETLYYWVMRGKVEYSEIDVEKSSISKRFHSVTQRVNNLCTEYGRNPESVSIISVSKKKPAEIIVAGVLAGIRDLGENRFQEAETKIPTVKEKLLTMGFDIEQLTWHMIGKVQSNKAARIARLFDCVHSIENVKVADKISRASLECNKVMDIFIEINTSGETRKGGIRPADTGVFLRELLGYKGIAIKGLMTIGPLTDSMDEIRNSFRLLRDIGTDLVEKNPNGEFGEELSMGMSNDYDIALEEGATILRIGTAIFGKRQ